MRIAVVCANGRVGSLVVKEAVSRGIDVTAIARDASKTVSQHAIEKDLFDITKEDLAGYDAVIDAFGILTDPQIRRYFQLGCEVKALGRGHLARIKREVKEK